LPLPLAATERVSRTPGTRLKLSLNAYSFNDSLRAGRMSLDDVIRFCAEQGVDGLDATGYYMPGYPAAPADDYLHRLKRTAFVNGVTLSGTGVKNDFATADTAARQRDVQLVKNWIEVAAKLGAPVLRVFSGPRVPAGHTFEEALAWMLADMQECVAYGRSHGVMLGLQQHDDFLKTARETIRLIDGVNSEWFGVILDVGSLRQGDPYEQIEQLLPYAVSWQIKERVWSGPTSMPVDLRKLKSLIDRSGYRGFLPVEALDAKDEGGRVAQFIAEVRQEFRL
ncbi:MAG: sugar phosphate isomerase/epimerase family protein, partial [Opitutaceae bacterium]